MITTVCFTEGVLRCFVLIEKSGVFFKLLRASEGLCSFSVGRRQFGTADSLSCTCFVQCKLVTYIVQF